jgi:bifunctional non-homologous end joining protein LigD
MQRTLREHLDPLLRKRAAFADPPREAQRDVRWVDPVLVAQITFSNWTRDNLVRQAAFKGLREDKPAEEVVRETAEVPRAPAPSPTTSSQEERRRNKRRLPDASGPGFAITHPDKVLDESTGLTKKALAAYYTAVSSHLLRYIADRPLSIVRCPEGSSKACFFQKHVGSGVPESVKTIAVPKRKGGGRENYLSVDSADGLVGLAQMGVLEIHSWGSRNESLDLPDQIVIDLDPDVSIDFKTLAGSAQELRKHLQDLGLKSFLKGTGGKGLHVVIPIRPEHDWSIVKEFSHAIVRQLEQGNPELYVTKMTKAVRKNHIYLDYLRNDREATTIAPFSPRARAGAPVALPLDWKELRANAMPVFRVADFAKWKTRLKRDRWAAMNTLHQRLSRGILRDAGIGV